MDPNKPQGTQDQSGQGEGDSPKYVTEEQLNRAISARLGDFQKKVEKNLEAGFASFMGKLDEKLETIKPQTGAPQGDQGKSADLENSPIVKGLQKQLADQKAASDALKAERDAEKATARNATLRTRLAEELTRGGVDPKYVKNALAVLVDAEKRVRFADDESDELVYRDATGDVDLSTGLKSWLKSDDAKIYLPPRGTQGSGDRSTGRNTSNGQPLPTLGQALLGMARSATGQGDGQPT